MSDQVDRGDHQVGVVDRLFYEFEQSQVTGVLELCGTYIRGVDQEVDQRALRGLRVANEVGGSQSSFIVALYQRFGCDHTVGYQNASQVFYLVAFLAYDVDPQFGLGHFRLVVGRSRVRYGFAFCVRDDGVVAGVFFTLESNRRECRVATLVHQVRGQLQSGFAVEHLSRELPIDVIAYLSAFDYQRIGVHRIIILCHVFPTVAAYGKQGCGSGQSNCCVSFFHI